MRSLRRRPPPDVRRNTKLTVIADQLQTLVPQAPTLRDIGATAAASQVEVEKEVNHRQRVRPLLLTSDYPFAMPPAPPPSPVANEDGSTSVLLFPAPPRPPLPPPLVAPPPRAADALRLCLPFWRDTLKAPPTILRWIQHGVFIPFLKKPPACPRRPPPYAPREPTRRAAFFTEINRLISKGVLVNCPAPRFFSPLFLIPKPGKPGQFRLITDFRRCNDLQQRPPSFRMETIQLLPFLCSPGAYFCSLDIADAYFAVPIAPQHQPFFALHILDECNVAHVYMLTVIPFGWSWSPYLFTTLLRPVSSFLRRHRIVCSWYLDDSIVIAQQREQARADATFTKGTLQAAGFPLNERRTSTEPVQSGDHLGFLIDTVNNRLALPSLKCMQLQARAKQLTCSARRRARWVPLKALWSFLGQVSASLPAVRPARLFSRHLQLCLHAPSRYSDAVRLTSAALAELQWWIDDLPAHSSSPLWMPAPDVELFTDASEFALGAVLSGAPHQMSLPIPPDANTAHIAYLELLAVERAVNYFHLKGVSLSLVTDSSVVHRCLSKMGTHSLSLLPLLRRVWKLFCERQISCTVRWIPSASNPADAPSRVDHSSEFTLIPSAWDLVLDWCGPFDVDVFASPRLSRAQRFVAPWAAVGAEAVDALSLHWEHSWHGLHLLVFPPPHLILRAIGRFFATSTVQATFVVPRWLSAPWWPFLHTRPHRQLRLPQFLGRAPLSFDPRISSAAADALRHSEWVVMCFPPSRQP